MEIALSCGGRDCSGQAVGITLVRELGRIPFLRASLNLEPGDKAAAFKPGAEVELKAGPEGKVRPLFKGVLTGLGLNRRSGENLLELEARDKAHALALGQNSALFLEKSDAEICKALLANAGVAADIPSTAPAHKQLQQVKTSDWEFILSRLWANALVPLVRDGKLTALRADKLGADNVLELDAEKDEILELELRQDHRAWLGSVTARSWDEAKQSERKKKSAEAAPKLAGGAAGSGKTAQELLIPHALEADELAGLGAGLLWRSRHGLVCGRVRLAGLAGALPGDGLKLKNISDLADGRAVIWGTRLELRPGACVLDLQFGCDFLGQLGQGLGQSAKNGLSGWLGGDLPQVAGLYPAKVLKLSGDPENGERIQVHIPLLHEEGQGVWARWAAPYAGSGYAVVFRPEKDDEVLLGFLGGDPRAPVILGALPSKAAPAPAALKAGDEKNKLKGWVSKSGLTLLLDEEDKSVSVKTPGGQSLVIDDKAGSVVLKDKNNNTVTLDKSGVTIKSAKDIVLEATGNLKLKATQNFSAEGLDASVQGQKALKLNGQVTGELKAGGPLTVKGAIVQIN